MRYIRLKSLFLNWALGPREVKDPKASKKDDKLKKKEQKWVGIGLGSGQFGEEQLKTDIKKQREARSIFNEPPKKQKDDEIIG